VSSSANTLLLSGRGLGMQRNAMRKPGGWDANHSVALLGAENRHLSLRVCLCHFEDDDVQSGSNQSI
jgi:hypothetical protein